MSDPVSNAEIEDVLSSIRRLVSEDPSPLHRRKRIAEGAKERFVLTPALRVEGAAAESESDGATAQQEQAAEVDKPKQASEPPAEHPETSETPQETVQNDRFAESRTTLEQRIAELEAALQQSPDEWEPDGSEVAKGDAPGIPDFAETEEKGALEDLVQEAEPTSQIEEMPDAPDPEARAKAESLDEGDQGRADGEDSWSAVAEETLAEETDPEHLSEIEIEAWQDSAADAEDARDPKPAETQSDTEPGETTDFVEDEDVPEEAVFSHVERAQEPELTGESDAFEDAEDVDDPAEMDFAPSDPDRRQASELFEDSNVLDEDTLRELVSQLVRDELQGVLGERITRNVRRLVRREIQRAIAARELE